jgi:hypothetical protein
MSAAAPETPRTARQIIERRLGRDLPVLRELDDDEKQAIKRLAIQLIRARRNPA